VRIAWLDREQAIAELRECAERLVAQDARVMAVGLFGSLARREALPSSDADVLIILRDHDQPRWFDRIPEYAAAFSETSLSAEPFAYTIEEGKVLASQSGFMRTVLRELVPLAGDQEIITRLRETKCS
jgi:predicted nucleotidyltransferase